jgi:hypothetical protein
MARNMNQIQWKNRKQQDSVLIKTNQMKTFFKYR